MTVLLAQPQLRPRRGALDFADEAARAASACRARAAVLRAEAADGSGRTARRLRREAAAHELEAQCHDEAVATVLGLVADLADLAHWPVRARSPWACPEASA